MPTTMCRKCADRAWWASSRCSNPSQSFEYTSGTVLTTQVGTMRGSYQMQAEDGAQFEVEIPQFVLSVPRVLH